MARATLVSITAEDLTTVIDLLTTTCNLGHSFRKSVHPGAFGPDLAKKLSQLVKMEKNVMRSMELVGRERMEVAVCSTWLHISEGP